MTDQHVKFEKTSSVIIFRGGEKIKPSYAAVLPVTFGQNCEIACTCDTRRFTLASQSKIHRKGRFQTELRNRCIRFHDRVESDANELSSSGHMMFGVTPKYDNMPF